MLSELAIADERIKVVHHPVNRRKGAAIRTAIEHMTYRSSQRESFPIGFAKRRLEGSRGFVMGVDFSRYTSPIATGKPDQPRSTVCCRRATGLVTRVIRGGQSQGRAF